MVYPCLEMRVYCFCVGIFHSSFGLMKYPYTKTIHVHLQTRIHHSLVLDISPSNDFQAAPNVSQIVSFATKIKSFIKSWKCLMVNFSKKHSQTKWPTGRSWILKSHSSSAENLSFETWRELPQEAHLSQYQWNLSFLWLLILYWVTPT